jgi:four helix bundle protein
MSASDYRELRVWNASIDLALECSQITNRLPVVERYGLGTQLRRSACSVPSNIAEGNHRLHLRDYVRCISIARGSLAEVHTQLELIARLGYVSEAELEKAQELTDHVGRMLTRLFTALRRRIASQE